MRVCAHTQPESGNASLVSLMLLENLTRAPNIFRTHVFFLGIESSMAWQQKEQRKYSLCIHSGLVTVSNRSWEPKFKDWGCLQKYKRTSQQKQFQHISQKAFHLIIMLLRALARTGTTRDCLDFVAALQALQNRTCRGTRGCLYREPSTGDSCHSTLSASAALRSRKCLLQKEDRSAAQTPQSCILYTTSLLQNSWK